MKILRTALFSLVFILGLNNASLACDLLGINIGGNKSEIEKYFGPIEIDKENEMKKGYITTTLPVGVDLFCPNANLGDSLIYAFIVNDRIAGISIEVSNGTNNEESKKQLLYNYVISNYGSIENSSSPNWTGYKTWSIGDREIIYTKIYLRKKFLIEELQITNAEYSSYMNDNEPNDE